MIYGVTELGFVKKPYDVIVEELEERYKEIFGPTINLEPQSPQGQLVGITAEAIYDTWEMAEHVFNSWNIDNVEGILLDKRALLKNEKRFNEESDSDFRVRIIEQLPNDVMQLKDELRDNLQRIEGVTELDVRYKKGLTTVWVVGGDDLAVAITIRDYMPPGDLEGNYIVKIDNRCDGISFYRPLFIPVKIEITLGFYAHLECECELITTEKVQDAILNNVCGLGYGDYLYKEYIQNILFARFKGLKIENISISSSLLRGIEFRCEDIIEFENSIDFVEVQRAEKIFLCRENLKIFWVQD